MTQQNAPEDAPKTRIVALAGPSFFPIALIARLPFAMMVVGVMTLVVTARGSLHLGGLTAAVVGLTTAACGPLIGAAADRWGQRPVVLLAGLGNALALFAMAWIAFSGAPDAAVLAVAVAIGASAPQVAPMSRGRLMDLINHRVAHERRPRLTAKIMAYESAADETVFILGPFVVGLLAVLSPKAPLVGAGLLAIVFVTAFALHRSASPAHHADGARQAQAPARDLARPALLVTVAGVFLVGLLFGTTYTALTAHMTERGDPARAALLYGFMGISSAIVALASGWFSTRFTPHARWLAFAGLLAVGTALFWRAESDTALVVALLVMGAGIGPTLVTQYHLGSDVSPVGRTSTVMTMMGAAITVGQALASATTGTLGESRGAASVMVFPLATALLLLGCGLLSRQVDRREANRRARASAAKKPAAQKPAAQKPTAASSAAGKG